MFEENDYLYDYDDDGLGDLDRSEDEDEEIEEEEKGVTDLIDDEEQEKKFEEQWKYEDYPNIDGIYNEGKDIEEVPEKYTPEQKALYIKGMNQIKQINKKHGCSLSFAKIVNYLDTRYISAQKDNSSHSSIFNSMSLGLWNEAASCALEMENRKAYAYDNLEIKDIEKKIKENYKEICKVIRLYAKIHPEKFPFNDPTANVSDTYLVFNSKGKLRKEFLIKEDFFKFDIEDNAYTFRNRAREFKKEYFGNKARPKDTMTFVLKELNTMLGGKNHVIETQGERVRKLAECVRFLRPLQARRDNRSIFEYITNHDVYVAERDTLRKCKEEMKRLGLSKQEISKVLHGGAFNDVKFNDGLTVRSKQLRPNEKDSIIPEQLIGDGDLLVNQDVNEEIKEPIEQEVSVDVDVLNKSISQINVFEAVDEEVIEFNAIEDIEKVEVVEQYIK